MTRTPIVRPISWKNAIVNLTVLGCFVSAGWLIDRRYGVVAGSASYLILSVSLRTIIARHHRRAISFSKRQQFDLAIPEIEKSLEFFRSNA